jgi:hypothetical protein
MLFSYTKSTEDMFQDIGRGHFTGQCPQSLERFTQFNRHNIEWNGLFSQGLGTFEGIGSSLELLSLS